MPCCYTNVWLSSLKTFTNNECLWLKVPICALHDSHSVMLYYLIVLGIHYIFNKFNWCHILNLNWYQLISFNWYQHIIWISNRKFHKLKNITEDSTNNWKITCHLRSICLLWSIYSGTFWHLLSMFVDSTKNGQMFVWRHSQLKSLSKIKTLPTLVWQKLRKSRC